MRMQDTMFSMIGDMPLPVDVQIGPSWGVLTEYERDGDHLIAVD